LKKLNLDRLRPSDFITTAAAGRWAWPSGWIRRSVDRGQLLITGNDRKGIITAGAGKIGVVLGKDPARRSTLASGSSPGEDHHHRPGEDRRGPRQGSGAAVNPGQRFITSNDREEHVTTCSR
jgi:hypothetical protein